MSEGLNMGFDAQLADPSGPDEPAVHHVVPADARPLLLRVSAIELVADTVRAIELVSADGAPLPPFTAGAHINLKLPGELSRSYSLTNGPETLDRYAIAVNRDPNSRGGSAYIAETLKVGDVLPVDPPHNTFPLVEDAELNAFFAGGIGITPILSMIRRLEALGRPWKLFYGARSRSTAAFVDELEALEASSPGRVLLHFDSEAGKVMPLLKLASGIPKAAHIYCCGPGRMIETFKASAGWRPSDNVHIEHFVGTNAKPTTAFDVELKRSGKQFHVEIGESIMQVLERNGIQVSHSCREGVCGTCETRVLAGIPDHKDNVLSTRERDANNVMLICCSGAKSEKLILDL
ncbi:MAG: Vanillate O-demethylase ferredoxin subunit [Devosia sp.]|uniref:PDR/VanB family oxidoreductase n=1 Tax=Devosia sp. TaxID=1871048 RepID=UPI00261632C9|nr:PDR/VanB family oxidoreductase [Devosia sp.]MDB5531100.1 Vanillate O-demethylase ferredoxin subunit [Devosia sp.]